MYNPQIVSKAGVILASHFQNMNIDYIVTVETKGIPLAYEVAKSLGIELVIIRKRQQKLQKDQQLQLIMYQVQAEEFSKWH